LLSTAREPYTEAIIPPCRESSAYDMTEEYVIVQNIYGEEIVVHNYKL
jgi:hypothetical protein